MRLSFLAAGLLCGLAGGQTAWSRTLDVYTLDAPPMVIQNAAAQGLVVDILTEAARRGGLEIRLNFLPWLRSQERAANGEDLLIIPLVRTVAREAHYTWIAPVFKIERSFATLDRPIDSFEQVKRQKSTVLVGIGSAQEKQLIDNGIDKTQIHTQVIGMSEVQMLVAGRVDAWFNGTPETLWKWRRSGQPGKLIIGKTITVDEVYIACSLKCSPEIRVALATAVAAMRQDGTLEKITAGYLASE